jgi:hypothetical protein
VAWSSVCCCCSDSGLTVGIFAGGATIVGPGVAVISGCGVAAGVASGVGPTTVADTVGVGATPSVELGGGVGVSPGVPIATAVPVLPGGATSVPGVKVPGVTVKPIATVGLPGNGVTGVPDATAMGDTVLFGSAVSVSIGKTDGSATIRGARNDWVGVGSSVGDGLIGGRGRCLVGVGDGDGVGVKVSTRNWGAVVGDRAGLGVVSTTRA